MFHPERLCKILATLKDFNNVNHRLGKTQNNIYSFFNACGNSAESFGCQCRQGFLWQTLTNILTPDDLQSEGEGAGEEGDECCGGKKAMRKGTNKRGREGERVGNLGRKEKRPWKGGRIAKGGQGHYGNNALLF